MNLSKKNDPRCWKKWARSGAVALGNATVQNLGRGMCLLRFTQPTLVKDVIASMERIGGRPMPTQLLDTLLFDDATTRRIRRINASYPIIALGSEVGMEGRRCVARLCDSYFRSPKFLFVRK